MEDNNILYQDISVVPQVGEKIKSILEKMDIYTVWDIVTHFPIRYLDLSQKKSIVDLKVGEDATIVGIIIKTEKKYISKNRQLVLCLINDSSSYIYAIWFNREYLAETLKPGLKIAISGKVSYRYGKLQVESPFYEVIDDEEGMEHIHTNRIIPIHPATSGISPRYLRRIIKNALDMIKSEVSDPLSDVKFDTAINLMPLERSIFEIHFPSVNENIIPAGLRHKWDELFFMQLSLAIQKNKVISGRGYKHFVSSDLRRKLLGMLSFDLTASQNKVLHEIDKDMSGSSPMHRLLQGDVGSGKTIIAVLAMLNAKGCGFQSALMAPTEILASQHYYKYKAYFDKLNIRSALLTGGLKEQDKKQILNALKSGEINIVFGTHAIIQENVSFKELSLIIVDEQHRFGVEQRARFREKGYEPDMLVMTATPIPRTLALTYYGDLDISIMDEKPLGRQPIETILITDNDISYVDKEINKFIQRNEQVYIVCPSIEDNEKSILNSVEKEIHRWQNHVDIKLNNEEVAALHSRLSTDEKNSIIENFRDGIVKIIISTTVIEVGVDIPNASLIVILNAERFGLSQLHQMRGRVGRGNTKSKCILVTSISNSETIERLASLVENSDGFILSEIDLKLRREGQLFGKKQWGQSSLKMASLPRDIKILQDARKEAFDIVNNDPELIRYPQLKSEVKRRYKSVMDWFKKS